MKKSMKKKPLMLATAVVLAGLALLLVFLVRPSGSGGDGLAVDPLDREEIVSLRILEGFDTLVLSKKQDGWVIGEEAFPVDSLRFQNTMKVLFSVREDKVSKDSVAALTDADFGPNVSIFIEWTLASGETKRMEVGGPADADYQTVYWRRPGTREVYRTGAYIEALTPDADDWKSREVFSPFLYEDVHSVEVTWRDSIDQAVHYKMERTSDTSVRLVEPDTIPVMRQNAAEIYVQTPQFAVDEFVVPGDPNLAYASLDTPMVHVRIRLLSGRMHEIKAGRAFGGYYYARHPQHGHPVRIAAWRFNFFRKTVKYILTPLPVPVPFSPE